MGMVIIVITAILIVVAVLLFISRCQLQRLSRESKAKEKMQIYEDIDLTQIIESTKNVAYETPTQTH